MHEETKLNEAKYFYSMMLQELNDKDKFTYNLSAFLTSARSVLQLALKEAGVKTGGEQWYNNFITASSVLRFFKDKRDLNIHSEPVEPAQDTDIALLSTVYTGSSVSILLTDVNGKVLNQSPPKTHKPKPKALVTAPRITIRYKFADWSGSEDIITLALIYLDELQCMVRNGILNKFLTG